MDFSTLPLPQDNSWDNVPELKLPEDENEINPTILNLIKGQALLSRIQYSIKDLLLYREHSDTPQEEIKDIPTLHQQETPAPKKRVPAPHIQPYFEGLSIARQILGLPPYDGFDDLLPRICENAVIICIDFENGRRICQDPNSETTHAQMGVCILDTGIDLDDAGSVRSPAELMRTYHFSTSATPKLRSGKYVHFLFGETKQTSLSNFKDELEKLVDRGRDIVLLGHDINHDLEVLDAIGFDTKTGIVAVLDTQELAKTVLGTLRSRSPLLLDLRLEGLLIAFGCEYRDLHVGGNDANFTMRALILLAVESLGGLMKDPRQRLNQRVIMLKRIARDCLPKVYESAMVTPKGKLSYLPKPPMIFPAGEEFRLGPVSQDNSPFEPGCLERVMEDLAIEPTGAIETQRAKMLQDLGFTIVQTPFETCWRARPVTVGVPENCGLPPSVEQPAGGISETKIDQVLKWRMQVEQQCRMTEAQEPLRRLDTCSPQGSLEIPRDLIFG